MEKNILGIFMSHISGMFTDFGVCVWFSPKQNPEEGVSLGVFFLYLNGTFLIQPTMWAASQLSQIFALHHGRLNPPFLCSSGALA